MNKTHLLISTLAIVACDSGNAFPLEDGLAPTEATGKADGVTAATTIEIEPTGDGQSMSIRGFAASELFDAMESAGLEVQPRPGYELIVGQSVACAANTVAAHCAMLTEFDVQADFESFSFPDTVQSIADKGQAAEEIADILQAAQQDDSFVGWSWQCDLFYADLSKTVCHIRQDTGRLTWAFRHLALPAAGQLYGVWVHADDGSLIHVGRTNGEETLAGIGTSQSFVNRGGIDVGPDVGRRAVRAFLTLESNSSFSPTSMGQVLFSGDFASANIATGSWAPLGVQGVTGTVPGGVATQSF